MDKEDVIHTHTRMHAHAHTHTHTHNVILLSHKKRMKILPFATTWMDLEGILLSEISQKDNYCMISLICRI